MSTRSVSNHGSIWYRETYLQDLAPSAKYRGSSTYTDGQGKDDAGLDGIEWLMLPRWSTNRDAPLSAPLLIPQNSHMEAGQVSGAVVDSRQSTTLQAKRIKDGVNAASRDPKSQQAKVEANLIPVILDCRPPPQTGSLAISMPSGGTTESRSTISTQAMVAKHCQLWRMRKDDEPSSFLRHNKRAASRRKSPPAPLALRIYVSSSHPAPQVLQPAPVKVENLPEAALGAIDIINDKLRQLEDATEVHRLSPGVDVAASHDIRQVENFLGELEQELGQQESQWKQMHVTLERNSTSSYESDQSSIVTDSKEHRGSIKSTQSDSPGSSTTNACTKVLPTLWCPLPQAVTKSLDITQPSPLIVSPQGLYRRAPRILHAEPLKITSTKLWCIPKRYDRIVHQSQSLWCSRSFKCPLSKPAVVSARRPQRKPRRATILPDIGQ